MKVPHLAVLLLTLATCLFACSRNIKCNDTNCSDYFSQSDAQSAFNADPECRSDLDADNDGLACEDWFTTTTTSNSNTNGGSSGCPTTAACGCSNKTKAECGPPCCQWIVGDGCDCL